MAAPQNRTYERILENRNDMTQWLIHFTRPNPPRLSLDVLKQILTEGVLRPTFAQRNKVSTIYGPNSAVCFTEQPIGSMMQYILAREEPSFISGYGIIISKSDLYAAGGLPVIYGLDYVKLIEKKDDEQNTIRIIDPTILSPDEQYRYVTFDPYRGIDWTHEREWRWSSKSLHANNQQLFFLGRDYAGGKGYYSGEIHVFVENDCDIINLQQYFSELDINAINNLLWNDRAYSIPWYETLKSVNIISLETIRRNNPPNATIKFEKIPATQRYRLINK